MKMINDNKNIDMATDEYAEMFDEALMGRQINEILGDDFEFLGLCSCDDRLFTVLKTSLEKGGEKIGVMILEIDDLDPITEYSFCIVDDRDLIMKVFRRFCEKYKEENNG